MGDKTKQVPVSEDLHTEIKVKAAREGKTLRQIVEDALRRLLGIDNEKDDEQEKTA
jgi:predicted HicB family RNase H-like nuclease